MEGEASVSRMGRAVQKLISSDAWDAGTAGPDVEYTCINCGRDMPDYETARGHVHQCYTIVDGEIVADLALPVTDEDR